MGALNQSLIFCLFPLNILDALKILTINGKHYLAENMVTDLLLMN